MQDHSFSLTERHFIALDTLEVAFTPKTPYSYQAGQYADVTIPNPPYSDQNGNTRTFSFVSEPSEEKEVRIALRMSESAYKRSLLTLSLGNAIRLSRPMGYFSFHEQRDIPAVCLAGGIGIAPFCSLIKKWAQQSPFQLQLFYSNPSPVRTAYLSFFERLAKHNRSFSFIPTITQSSSPKWTYDYGHVTEKTLRKHLPQIEHSVFYLCGSDRFIEGISSILQKMGISENNIKTENFGVLPE